VTARGPATRAELLRGRRLLGRVEEGAALLRRKREALVRELVPLARPAAEARREIAEAADAAYAALLDALASHGAGQVAATARPPRVLDLELEIHRVWGVVVPHVSDLPAWDRGLAARATAPGVAGPAQVEAANRFERLGALLLAALTRETQVRALGAALSRTSRQLHTLEQRVAPELAARVARVARALDERDREEHNRLRRLRRRSQGARFKRNRAQT